MSDQIEKIKLLNIIEMAVQFTGMIRVFNKGSSELIKNKCDECIYGFFNLPSEQYYKIKHAEFCQWFTKNIRNSKTNKEASWGQAAKVIDIILKVCIYYCNLPSVEKSSKISPWLNSAIDTPILKDLLKRYGLTNYKISTIKSIDREIYDKLQNVVREDIKNKFSNNIFPVQYDDLKWREFNKNFKAQGGAR